MDEILGAFARVVHIEADPRGVPLRFFDIPDVLDYLRAFPEWLYEIVKAPDRPLPFKKNKAPPLGLLHLGSRSLKSVVNVNRVLPPGIHPPESQEGRTRSEPCAYLDNSRTWRHVSRVLTQKLTSLYVCHGWDFFCFRKKAEQKGLTSQSAPILLYVKSTVNRA